MYTLQSRLKLIALYIFIVLLAYMPLHIFLSTWLGTSFNVLEVAKVLKDVVLVVGFICAFGASLGTSWLLPLFRRKIVLLIAAYAALTLVLAVVHGTDTDAEILGVVYNLRFLLIFVYALLLGNLFDLTYVRRYAVKTVIAVGVFAALIGVIQYTVLPDSFLTHFGYSRANGVLPAFFIDDKPDLERAMATLRDPNSFGSYLIIIGSVLTGLALKTYNRDLRIMFGGVGILVGMSFLYTFSRSAWLGATVAVGTFGVLYAVRNRAVLERIKDRRRWLVVAVVAVLLLVGGLVITKDSYFVQNVIFHADEATVLEDPNELRLRFWSESIDSAVDQPLGYGPGTAGLASIRNDKQGIVLNENYYLQILHEVGTIGLLLFLAIIAATVWLLYTTYVKTGNLVALALLAALIGLAVTNFLVHIWSNETVAYTFWSLAGLYVIYEKEVKIGKMKHIRGRKNERPI
jgi:O-Antigen ligase